MKLDNVLMFVLLVVFFIATIWLYSVQPNSLLLILMVAVGFMIGTTATEIYQSKGRP